MSLLQGCGVIASTVICAGVGGAFGATVAQDTDAPTDPVTYKTVGEPPPFQDDKVFLGVLIGAGVGALLGLIGTALQGCTGECARAAVEGFNEGLNSSNPVTDDDSLQREMEALAESERARKAEEAEQARQEREQKAQHQQAEAEDQRQAGEQQTALAEDAQRQRAQAEQAQREQAAAVQQQQAEQLRREQEQEQRKQEAQRAREEQARQARENEEQRKRDAAAALSAALDQYRNGIRLKATKCPDGEGNYYVIGTRPRVQGFNDLCLNVEYRAVCSPARDATFGTLYNFVGGGGCFGDSTVIDPKPACDVKAVTVHVERVTSGCK